MRRWTQRRPLKKHEPFQQCCNTVSFWFKHTHTLTNAKCTHYQILRSAFPRTTGESFNAVNPRGCPNHPHFVSKWLISHFVFAHWQCPLCCSSAVDSQVLCSHSFCFFSPNRTTYIIVLKWRLSLQYWHLLTGPVFSVNKEAVCNNHFSSMYRRVPTGVHTGTIAGLLSESCACA